MRRLLQIAGKISVQLLAFAGLGLFVIAAIKLSNRGGEWLAPAGSPTGSGDAGEHFEDAPPGDDRQLVILDPGHGGRDGGTVAGGALEKALNLDTAERVARHLEAGGVRVMFTRDDDRTLELSERARLSNRTPAALFVSIHQNAVAGGRSANGVETYYSHPKPSSVLRPQRSLFEVRNGESFIDRRGEEFARSVQSAVCDATGANDRGIKNKNLAVTRWVSCPAILVECGFLSNPAESKKLQSESYRETISRGIADGVLAFLKQRESDPLLGVSFPDRVATSELADIPLPAGG
jgi:N-acetylmuramoyl-L-alanine amidase